MNESEIAKSRGRSKQHQLSRQKIQAKSKKNKNAWVSSKVAKQAKKNNANTNRQRIKNNINCETI